MNTLFLTRHGESIANANTIIQGSYLDYDLSERGISQANEKGKQFLGNKIGKIISSTSKRASHTGTVIGSHLGISSITQHSLVYETGAGILEGLTKQESIKKYPSFIEIWHTRGDLDQITGAEKGATVQSRAILFLLECIRNRMQNTLLVSHAGFLRSLYNTGLGRPRTNSINIDFDTILKLNINELGFGMHGFSSSIKEGTLFISAYDGKYVAKEILDTPINTKRLHFQKFLIKQLKEKLLKNIPELFHINSLQDGIINYINEYIEGKDGYEAFSGDSIESIAQTFIEIEGVLQSLYITEETNTDFLPSLKDIVDNVMQNPHNPIAGGLLKELILKNKVQDLISRKESLVNYDTHPGNLIFHRGSFNGIIDWDNIMVGPSGFQISSIRSGIQLLGDLNLNKTLDTIFTSKGIPITEEIEILTKIRNLIGFAYFEQLYYRSDNLGSPLQEKIFRAYKKLVS